MLFIKSYGCDNQLTDRNLCPNPGNIKINKETKIKSEYENVNLRRDTHMPQLNTVCYHESALLLLACLYKNKTNKNLR